ncbi:MAG: thioesterase family protein [Bacteroidota bacterium]
MPETSLPQLLKDYPVITKRVVNWRDIDPALHVSNTKYLEWAEMGRIDYLGKYYQRVDQKEGEGIGPVIAAIKIQYLYPVGFPDEVLIGTRMFEMGGYKYVLEANIVSQKYQKSVAKAKSKMVLFDFVKGKKVKLPESFHESIKQFEADILSLPRT